jgi:hypothetical protein
MSGDREHEPTKQPPVPPRWAEPDMALSPFFDMRATRPAGGELVVPQQQPLVNEQQAWPPPPQQAGPVANQSADSVSPQQSPQGQGLAAQHEAQLQRLCRHLRRTGRCPGECVLSRARQNRRLRGF